MFPAIQSLESTLMLMVAAQDEVLDPRQILARPTWVADKLSGATSPNGLEKIWVEPSVWPMAIFFCLVRPIPTFRSVWPGQYPHFGQFSQANIHISVYSVWPIPLFRSVWSVQYPHIGLFGLANMQISV